MIHVRARQYALLAAVIIGCLLFQPLAALAGDAPGSPPLPDSPASTHPRQDAHGLWRMDGAGAVKAAAVPAAAGGPDDYGYTWDTNVAFNWIDATRGADTGMSGYSEDQRVGPITLPFAFKYYAGTYSSIYIAASGYVAFQDSDTWRGQLYMPSPAPPNAVVNPYSTPLDLASSGRKGRVFYLAGGAAPNRYFAVAWNEVGVSGEDDLYTFEVVLYENGTIDFQYKTMRYNADTGYYCGYAGIEDAGGLVGLSSHGSCDPVASNSAVRFYRPQPTGRVSISPRGQGAFTKAGASESFRVTATNSGELGADSYKVTLTSTWPAEVTHTDGSPLADTDGDGAVDTGPIAQGSRMELNVRVQTPAFVSVADNNSAVLKFSSTRNPSWQRSTVLRTAVPAPFAQAYEDDALYGVRVDFADPQGSRISRLTQDPTTSGSTIAALPNGGHVVAWGQRFASSWHLRYVFLDKDGVPTSPVRSLLRPDGSAPGGRISEVAVTVALDGIVGIAWKQRESRENNGAWEYLENVYLATLDGAGSSLLPPTDVTKYTAYGEYGGESHPMLYNVQITPSGAGRFVMAWEIEMWQGGQYTDNVFYTVRSANNDVVKPVAQLSATDQLGLNHAEMPVLTTLSDNHVILAYDIYTNDLPVSFVELSSEGNLVGGPVTLGADPGYPQAATQLSDGSILFVWLEWYADVTRLYYAVVDRATYTVRSGPTWLENPASATGDLNASVAPDAKGHVAVTWGEQDYYYRHFLYYALIAQEGTLLTPPTAFLTAKTPADGSNPRLTTTFSAYAIAANRAYDPSSTTLPDVSVTAPSLTTGPSGGITQLAIGLANQGLPIASSVVVTAQLDSQLTYVSAVPEPSLVAAAGAGSTSEGGAELTWNVPSLSYLTYGRILLSTSVPSATIGSTYPVTITVSHSGADYDDGDMTIQTQVMVAEQLFTPMVAKGDE